MDVEAAVVVMQGQLMKWTNYVHGYQPRWFVLSGGVLSYYTSQEEVETGCRGSVNVTNSYIDVAPDSPVNFSIANAPYIPIYLQATSTQERQRWIIALANSKLEGNANEGQGAPHQESSVASLACRPETNAAMREIKSARKALVKQVIAIQARIQMIHDTKIDELKKGHETKLVKDTTVASDTCTKLLKALKRLKAFDSVASDIDTEASDLECGVSMRLASPSSKQSFFPTGLTKAELSGNTHSGELSKQNSDISQNGSSDATVIINEVEDDKDHSGDILNQVDSEMFMDAQSTTSDHQAVEEEQLAESTIEKPSENATQTKVDLPEKTDQVKRRAKEEESFFSSMPHSFTNLALTAENEIPTEQFLEACRAILPFVDRLGTTLTPVKSDINGNITKLTKIYEQNPMKYQTLEGLVLSEVATKTTTKSGSGTDALLWLKRALEFINELLTEVVQGAESLTSAAGNAYSKTLSQYHGWMVRQVFSLAMKSVPYRKDFLAVLGPAEEDVVIGDMATFTHQLRQVLVHLAKFYSQNKLDSSAKA